MDFISLFSGGGGADIGAMLAGYTPVCANEYDAEIAAVYAENIGPHVRVGDILDQDPHGYPACDLLHASPPCPNFSVVLAGAEETPHDIALAEKVAEFIRVLAPRAVTIENVGAYRKSRSYQIILKAITGGGYMYDAGILCAADYGVPQTRRRFIVRAVKGLLRPMPAPVPWIGWLEAIEDLVDTLPDSQFAEWQLKRLPEELKSVLINPNRNSTEWVQESDAIAADMPYPTVCSGVRGSTFGRAFLACAVNADGTAHEREDIEPSHLANGRVVAMTPRALARFQSFPDWYKLPGNKALACKIIGNAAPPLMMRAVFETLK